MPDHVRVHLGTGTVTRTPLRAEELFIGGRALSSRLVATLTPPTCDPLGSRNMLVFAVGPLAGTLVSSCNRLSAGAKSPLTGTIKESNAGGVTGYMLGLLGIRSLTLEGVAADWSLLHVSPKGIDILPAGDLLGLETQEKAERLFARFGRRAGLTLIGPLGERLQMVAGIANTDPDGEPSRYNGRGGLGAVMGSKRVLAVVYETGGAQKAPLHDPVAFRDGMREVSQRLLVTPAMDLYRRYGTAAMIAHTQELGALPTCNFSRGRFDGVAAINHTSLHDRIVERGGDGRTQHACMKGCLIQCSNIFPDSQGRKVCSPIEYENLGLLGSNLGIASLDDIARLNARCNALGADTIELGAALGVVMEAGIAPFGDAAAAHALMDEVSKGSPLGRVLGSGAGIAGRVFGCRRVPTVKNQAMPAYDPRAIKGLGVTYATSPMGADHTAGGTARATLAQNCKDGQVDTSRNAQRLMVCLDSLGVCIFTGAAISLSLWAKLIAARFGITVSDAELRALGLETLRVERDFNTRAGFTPAHDQLPEFFSDETLEDCDAVFDLTGEELAAVHA